MIRRFSCEFVSNYYKNNLAANITLYYTILSPPSRTILLTAKAIGIELELKNVDLEKGENLTPEFLKINPQQTVPVIVDNGNHGAIIVDSHAIVAYLCDNYARDDQLYPRDSVKRAHINTGLHFDIAYLLSQFNDLFEEIFVYGATETPPKILNKIQKNLDIMERFLQHGPFLCGDHLSIADISCIATLSSMDTFWSIEKSRYPKLVKWIHSMKSFSFYEENRKAAEDVQELMRNKIKENQLAKQNSMAA